MIYRHLHCDCPLSVPPVLKLSKKFDDEITLPAGKSTIVEVPFTGSPQPKVVWLHNGRKLPDPTRITVETIHNMTALTLSRVKRTDAGKYSLGLQNASGTVDVSVKLNVVGESPRLVWLYLVSREVT